MSITIIMIHSYEIILFRTEQDHTQQRLYLRNIMLRKNRLVVAKVEGVWGGKAWEFGISRCKLLYIEWINSRVLLYNTGNYIQYLVINHSGKEYEKECIYVYN